MQPTGHLRKKFNAMINRVAKMHTIFPLNVNWPKQTSQSFRQAFEYIEVCFFLFSDLDFFQSNNFSIFIIQVDFDLDGYPNAHQYIKFKLNNTWRRYRNYIKEKYFDPFVDDESTERMYASLPPYIDRFTFEKCVEELWTTEEFKVLFYIHRYFINLLFYIVSCLTLYMNSQRKSKINKTNRSKKILNHKTGSIPFSAIRENLQSEGIEASRINVLIRSSGTDNEVVVSLSLFYNVHKQQFIDLLIAYYLFYRETCLNITKVMKFKNYVQQRMKMYVLNYFTISNYSNVLFSYILFFARR